MSGVKQGHRAHALVVRSCRKEALFTPTELASVARAAKARGLKVGAFVATAAVEAADASEPLDGGMPAAAEHDLAHEVRELRRLLGNVAGNLNDVARHANSTGVLTENVDAILSFTRRTNARIDAWVVDRLPRRRW